MDCGFLVCGTWIRDSNRQWDSVFIELSSGFQIPLFRIPLEYLNCQFVSKP